MKKYLLPAVAAAVVVLALAVVLIVPGQAGKKESTGEDEGKLLISASELSDTEMSVIKLADSKAELIAIKGADGSAKVALGTCQSCNGSPGAYYTQNGDNLQCNNCGLTFPLSIIGENGAGCHPIMLTNDVLTYTDDGAVVDIAALKAGYGRLFLNVAEH